MRTYKEIRDGREFTVTVLPSDARLQPARTKKRAFGNVRARKLDFYCYGCKLRRPKYLRAKPHLCKECAAKPDPKQGTFAEGFARAAVLEDKRLAMHSEIAKRLRS